MTKRKNPEDLMKKGRPPIPYDPDRHPEWVRGLARRDATVPEICGALGISNGTFDSWKIKYPDFLAALQIGRMETVERLKNALAKKAVGFSIPAEEEQVTQNPDGSKTVRVTKKNVYFPPDVGAAKILLVNLDNTFKTDRVESEITGNSNKPLEVNIATIDPETAEALKRLYRTGAVKPDS